MTKYDCNKANLTASPCIRNCCLDGQDICLGCFRHIDEIIAWQGYTKEEKARVLALCQQRKDNKPAF